MTLARKRVTMKKDITWSQLRCGKPARVDLLVKATIYDVHDVLGDGVAEGVIEAIIPERMEIKLKDVVWIHRDREKWNELNPEIRDKFKVAVVSSNTCTPAGFYLQSIERRSEA